jgi:predicted transcriptional regulator
MPPKTELGNVIINELVKRVNEDSRRLRSLEERSRALETKFSSISKDIIEIKEFLKTGFEDQKQFKKDLNITIMKLENEITKIKKILEKTVRRSELDEIENFIDLISPLNSQFVTRKELQDSLKQRS